MCDDRAVTTTERPLTPRQRGRVAALEDIKRLGREQIATSGLAGLSLREIARAMGLVSSAVYRYYPSREALLTALVTEAYDGLGAAVEAADAPLDRDDLAGRWRAHARALRAWAVEHPTDYTIVYGPPLAGYDAPPETYQPAQRSTGILFDALERGWAAGRLRPLDRTLPAELRAAVDELRERRGLAAPAGTVATGLEAWTQLHGLLAMELHGHLRPAVGAAGPLFADAVEAQLVALGLRAEAG